MTSRELNVHVLGCKFLVLADEHNYWKQPAFLEFKNRMPSNAWGTVQPITNIRKQSQENMRADWLKIVFDGNTELTRVVDVTLARAMRIYTLIIKVNKLFSFFSSWCFLKEIEDMFCVFLSSYRNTRKSLGELEKAVDTLACDSCSHSIRRSSKLPLVLLLNN